MCKEEFFKVLTGYLEILDENEQKDILDEYSQHIELKMQNGMSEEEAIRDFGDLNQLAAEILEAYHVSPSYREKIAAENKKARRTSLLNSASDLFKKLRLALSAPFRWSARHWSEFLLRRREKAALQQENKPVEKKPFLSGAISVLLRVLKRIGGCFVTAVAGLLRFASWCISIFIKAFLFCAGALLLFFALCLLAILGATAVLLLSGYPLFGIVLLALGGACALGSLAVLLLGAALKKKEKHEEIQIQTDESIPS